VLIWRKGAPSPNVQALRKVLVDSRQAAPARARRKA